MGGGHGYKLRGTKFLEDQSVVKWLNTQTTIDRSPIRIRLLDAGARQPVMAFFFQTLVPILISTNF